MSATVTKKMVIFDIDGTLLGSDKNVSLSTLEALTRLREQGHTLFLATGRSLFYTKPVIDLLGFENYILCNGAIGFINHLQKFSNELASEDLTSLLDRFSELEIDAVLVTLDRLHRVSSFDLAKMKNAMSYVGGDLPPIRKINQSKEQIYQVLAFYDQTADKDIASRFADFDFVRWHEHGVDILPAEGSKAATISAFAEQLAFEKKDIISFGDGLNDREMLQAAGVGVAMGNASAEVKGCADLVTDTNDNDGIFKALRRLALI